MGKSKHRKGHKSKVNKFKESFKLKRDSDKKKFIKQLEDLKKNLQEKESDEKAKEVLPGQTTPGFDPNNLPPLQLGLG